LCSARYKSYNATDNTYQPYGSELRWSCVAPASTIEDDVQQVSATVATDERGMLVRWYM
jgi:hypothetical protein